MEARASGVFSPAAGRRSLAQPHSQYTTTLLNTMDSMFKQNKSRFSMTQSISADMLSLLQTPKIMRKRRSENRPGPEDTMADSPQSILKVRQMVQRPLSPSAASDASVPVFPRLSARKAKTTAAAAAAVVEESALTLSRSDDPSLTPKQLRFHLPKVAAREKLRARRASRYSASTDEHVEEEEEGVEEEEEMVEEEEEMVEEEEEEEEPAQRVVGRRPMLSFDSERYVVKKVVTWCLLSCVD
ncbi:hypothetical protein GWK47_033213 [Chionoecetes opilio]|uniref:Uncharacterized protein n=1 Tax=Chionoecetes opilio TaxID=41210 RepID=A0A8J4YSD4_CHIOP|nr:hypothetical protein GWK47_033213 [Chionoecetes opilio]